jgi:hypothetical protein
MLATAHYATRKGLNRPFARVTARDRRIGHKFRYYGAGSPVAFGPRFAEMPHSPAAFGCRPGSAGGEAGRGPTVDMPAACLWLAVSLLRAS